MVRHEAELQTMVPVQLGDGQSPYAHSTDYCMVAELALSRALAQKYFQEARVDELTNIGNLRAFKENLSNALESSTENARVVVLYFDVDGLKRLNSAEGHAGGDELLKIVSSNVRRGGKDRDEDFWARLGGDEFGAILQGVQGDKQRTPETIAADIAARLEMRLNASIGEVDSWEELHLGVSVGMAVSQLGDTVESITERAEADMEVNKIARRKYLEARGIVFGDSREIVNGDDQIVEARRTRQQWEQSMIVDDYGDVVSE